MRSVLVIATALFIAPGSAEAKSAAQSAATTRETVVVLHGLARTPRSMNRMVRSLEHAGFHVCNIGYPSRKHAIETLVEEFVAPAVKACAANSERPPHFVTHSLGGIVLRQLAAFDTTIAVGRVVMLSPPNGGSEIVDKLGSLSLFKFANGPAGLQLGTSEKSLPRLLGPPTFEAGVITGNRAMNPLLSWMIPGTNDGKVSVENSKLKGMRDFRVVQASHTFIMNDTQAIKQTIHFLTEGEFISPSS